MKQVIIIHGRPDSDEFSNPGVPSPSNAHWFPWLQKQLIMQGELCQALEFPFKNEEPFYPEWVEVLESCKINTDTTLIGHSCGAGFLVRFLSENPLVVPRRVFLVAPWIDPEKTLTSDFFNFDLDLKFTHSIPVHIIVSADDMESVLDSVKLLENKGGVFFTHKFTDKEHFCTPEFPELLALLESK